MSLACCVPLIECVYCLACARWACKRCLHTADRDSETWGLASADDFEPVPRICRLILAVYEDDLKQPQWAPPGGYRLNTDFVFHRMSYEQTEGRAPPYLIYVDHENHDIVLAIRGLNMAKDSDYALLFDDRLGKKKLDGGYVHNGLLKAAAWILDKECQFLREQLNKCPDYTLTFAGHSLGSGVAAMLTILVLQDRKKLDDVERNKIRCYAIAPTRCMSLNLAVRYADVINSVVLQDDFLPRTATPLEELFKSLVCLPCILCIECMKDTCMSEEIMFRDQRRLYAPGRIYHIVDKKPFRCGRVPPIVRTAVPVDGRFDYVILSCNATADHAIILIEREAEAALELMLRKEQGMEFPRVQQMERQELVAKEHTEEHMAALQRAVSLAVPHAACPSAYGTFDESSGTSVEISPSASNKESWSEFIGRMFEIDESGKMVLRNSSTVRDAP